MGDIHGQATTDEMLEERELREAAEQNFPGLLIDSLPCTFVVLDSQYRLIRWNRHFQVVSEYSNQELISMTILDVVVDESKTAAAESLRGVFDGCVVRTDVICRTKSGQTMPIFVVCQQVIIAGRACIMGTGWDSTQHRLTELKLTDERNALNTLIDNLPDAIYIKDRESRFVLCNREVLRRNGVESLSQIVGRTDFDFYPADHARDAYADEQDLMQTGRPMINMERCVVDRSTGQPTWNLTTKVPLRNAANEIVGIMGIGRDVTERRRAEEAYHAIVDHSLQGLVVIQDMKVVFANQAMVKICGYTIDEMLGASGTRLQEFVHPLDREMVWRNHQIRLDADSLPDQYEFRAIRKDGSIRWLEIMTSRIDYQGQPAVQAACVDVTERHRAQEALRRSEARTRALLNANPDLMFRFTRGGMFLDCKPSKDGGVSASPAQFVGKHLDEVFPASTARTLMQLIQAAIDTGQVQTLEYSLPRTENESSDFECRLVACAEQEVVAIVRDISDRRRAEHLAKLQAEMAIRLSSLSDLKEGLQYCLEAAIRTSHMDCGGIYLLDEHSGSLKLAVHQGLSGGFVAETAAYPANSRNAQLIMLGQPAYAVFDDIGVPIGPAQKAERLRALAVVPIRHEGGVVACLNVASHLTEEISQWSRVVLETLAAQIGSAISRLKVQDALQRAEREKAIILNAMGQIVMYHDVSHRIRWANQVALDALNLKVDEIAGRRCFELWEGAAMPCRGCPVDLALRTGSSQESEIVGYNGGTWLVRGEPVRDDAGRLLGVVELAIDITRRKHDEEELRRRLQFEGLITNISADFANLQSAQIEAGVERMLAGIGSFLQPDRCFIYLFREGDAKTSKMHEWCADGIDPDHGRLQNVDADRLPRSLRQLQLAGILSIPSVQELRGEMAEAREILESISVKSLLIAPILVGSQLFGFLGISTVRQERQWPDDAVSLLKIAAETVANAMLRRQAEEALRASETRLRSIVRAAPTGIGLVSDRVFVEANDRVCEMLGYRLEELVNVPVRGLYPTQAEYDYVGRQMYGEIDRAGAGTVETRWLRKDGRIINVLLSSTPLDPGDRSKGVTFTALDITERKRAEQALQESERALRTLMANLPGLAYRCINAPGWPFEFVSGGILALSGYTPEEITFGGTVTYGDLIHPNDRQMVWDAVQDAVARNESFDVEYRIIAKDGQEKWVFDRGRMVPRSHAGSAVLEGFVMDITELKQAEAALRESDQNYHEIFNATNDAIFIHDAATGDILDVNRTALETLGYGREEVGTLNAEAAGTGESPFAREDALEWIRRTATEGPQLFEWHTRRKNGDLIWEEVSLRTAVIGGEQRVLAVARDITDRKRAETQTQEHLAELTRAWHANTLGEMASGLAHELNQPLCAIVNYSNGCLRLTRKKDYSMDTVRDSIERIAAQAQRAADIIKRIRSLVAKRDPQRTSLDLEVVLAEAVLLLRDEALKHNVAIISRLEPGLPKVRGDSVEIEQVVLNLMRNAIEAMSDGQTVHRNLMISTRLSNPEEVEVAVADTGRGISPELSEKIFDSFFTTKRQGLGIGLSLSTRIIEAHGGRLWVESDGRSGAIFRFTLPVEGATHGER